MQVESSINRKYINYNSHNKQMSAEWLVLQLIDCQGFL